MKLSADGIMRNLKSCKCITIFGSILFVAD
jgi:hypothetical protein